MVMVPVMDTVMVLVKEEETEPENEAETELDKLWENELETELDKLLETEVETELDKLLETEVETEAVTEVEGETVMVGEMVWLKDGETVTGADWPKAPITAAKRVTTTRIKRALSIFEPEFKFFFIYASRA